MMEPKLSKRIEQALGFIVVALILRTGSSKPGGPESGPRMAGDNARWRRYERPVGRSWPGDETYIKIRGRRVYLYRAVDAKGKTIDFSLSRTWDKVVATAFCRKAMKHQTSHASVISSYFYLHRNRFGQTTFATITGTVPDPSGVVLPGAKISVTSEGEGTVDDVINSMFEAAR